MGADDRLAAALAAIDRENAADPGGEALAYGRHMSEQLAALEPSPSAALVIACRAQHIRRWEIPRDRYPTGRIGYKKWRAELGRFHARHASRIAREAGFADEVAERVAALVAKQRLRVDPEAQTLEDVACLVFLRHHLGSFVAKHPRDKVIDILKKTWAKMSPRGREAALALELPADLTALIEEALS